MDVGILGPLTVTGGGAALALTRYKQRLLLAVLALRAGDAVPVDRLLDVLWEAAPPPTARKQIHAYVSAVRAQLVRAGEDGAAVQTGAGGYRLRVPPATVDLRRFTVEVATAVGERLAGRREKASDTLRHALALWRGGPLDGLRGQFVESEARRLEESRLAALQQRLDLDLSLGRHVELVPELTGLVEAYPLHDGLRTRLMVALQRSGRSADALAVGREGRRRCVEELGIEPADTLRATEVAILRGEPAGDPVVAAPVVVTHPTRPSQLPSALPDLAGRDATLSRVGTLLGAPGTAAAVVVTGMSGAGTSSVAVCAAHRARDRYPDGQLYLRMRGDDGRPVDPAATLGTALRALAPDVPVPSGPDERGRRYRELLTARRVLVVLDDVVDERQVRPLLPGGDRSATLIASHSWLPGLTAACPVELDEFTAEQAIDLLGRAADPDRIAAEPVAAAAVAELCGYLPLALCIAANRLRSRPQWTVRHLAETLAPQHRRLTALTAGDLGVRASLRAAYTTVSPAARHALRSLALLGNLEVPAAAALRGQLPDPEQALEELVDAHLLGVTRSTPTGGDRYRLPELVRLYAWEQAKARPAGRCQASWRPGWPSSTAKRFATEEVTFAGSDCNAEDTVTNSAVS